MTQCWKSCKSYQYMIETETKHTPPTHIYTTRPLTSMTWYRYYDSKSGGIKLIHGPKFTLVYFAVSQEKF